MREGEAGRVSAVSRSPGHTLVKDNQEAIRLRAGLGVDGDAHMGARIKHRSRAARDPREPNLRQIHLIEAELHDALMRQGVEVRAGEMGENITTRGIGLTALPLGTRLHLGSEAVVEVTGLRTPCAQLDRIQPGLMAATLERDAAGRSYLRGAVMAVVAVGGEVRPGDPVGIELPEGPGRPLAPV